MDNREDTNCLTCRGSGVVDVGDPDGQSRVLEAADCTACCGSGKQIEAHREGDESLQRTKATFENATRDQAGWYVIEPWHGERSSVIHGDFTRKAAFEYADKIGGRVVRLETDVI